MNNRDEIVLPSISKLCDMMVQDLDKFDKNSTNALYMLYLERAFELGKEVRDREITGNDRTEQLLSYIKVHKGDLT